MVALLRGRVASWSRCFVVALLRGCVASWLRLCVAEEIYATVSNGNLFYGEIYDKMRWHIYNAKQTVKSEVVNVLV